MYLATDLLKMSDAFRRESLPTGERWRLVLAENGIMLHPVPFPDLLYRGQNSRYSPCLPSIFRGIPVTTNQMSGISVEQQTRIVVRSAKSFWFRASIEKHPAIAWALKNNVDVDFEALSQHYELDTGYVDMSHDFEVAAFFATCRLQGTDWVPSTTGTGIIYRLELRRIPDYLQSLTKPVGLQPLPRPEEQGAWVTEVPMGHDLEKHPAVSWLEFNHDEAVSEHFLEKFAGGKALFPFDPLARVASSIKTSSRIPTTYIETAIRGYDNQPGGLPEKNALQTQISIFTSDLEPDLTLTESEIEQARVSWESRVHLFGEGSKVEPVRLVEVKPN